MSEVGDRPRELAVSTAGNGSNDVLVEVRESGSRLDPASLHHLFHSFYTTKPGSMGTGFAISRSIVEAHGAVFRLTLPVEDELSPDLVPEPSPS